MKAGKRILFALIVLMMAALACNAPGTTSGGSADVPTASPEVTYVVIVENTATTVPTDTPIPATSTPQLPPELVLSKNSNCRLGPSNFYVVVDQISAGKQLPVLGRSEDNEWWQVLNATGRECWIYYENATTNQDLSGIALGEAPLLPGIPLSFFVVDQACQPGAKKFTVTLSWSSGGGETAFRIFRDGTRLIELKPNKFNFKDAKAPLNKNLVYEIEAANENGTSEKAIQIVPACK